MSASNIPADVRRFLLAAIETVPHLEALLLLHSDPAKEWSAGALSLRLYIDEPTATRLLAELRDRHFVREERGDRWRFDAHDAARTEIIDRLSEVYARHVVEVAELIHSSSDRKAQRFADAFRWHNKES
jgi:DNA-binding transcriptional ArsR family regulator